MLKDSSPLIELYYSGTIEDWNSIDISSYTNRALLSAARYYYSRTQPTETGNYWHYAEDGATPVKW